MVLVNPVEYIFFDQAVLETYDAICFTRNIILVGNDDHGDPGTVDILEEFHYLKRSCRIQRPGGLIGKNDLGL